MASSSIHRDQLHRHRICCAPGTVLDAKCGPGHRGWGGGGGGGRDPEGLKRQTTMVTGRGEMDRLRGIITLSLTSESDWPVTVSHPPGTKDEFMPVRV